MNRSQVINVLGKPPHSDCQILGTVSIPFEQLKEYISQFPKGAELVVYCVKPSCYLAHQAASLLKTLGYYNIYLYQGGIAQWIKKGFPAHGNCAIVAPMEPGDQDIKSLESIDGVKELTAQQLNDKMSVLL